jgi:hypothetical protein
MPYTKAFPKRTDKSVYPRWEDVELSEEEEEKIEQEARKENVRLMAECIDDAKKLISEKGLKDFQSNIVSVAIALFDKRASHHVYWKERKAQEKFKEEDK